MRIAPVEDIQIEIFSGAFSGGAKRKLARLAYLPHQSGNLAAASAENCIRFIFYSYAAFALHALHFSPQSRRLKWNDFRISRLVPRAGAPVVMTQYIRACSKIPRCALDRSLLCQFGRSDRSSDSDHNLRTALVE